MRSSQLLNRLRSERFWGYALVVLIPLLTFLPLANSLGFYDDDWFAIWGGYYYGSGMIAEMHLFDRPFMGLVYGFHYNLLGNAPLAWQLYVGGIRVVAAVAMYWALRKIWPEQKFAILACTLIAVVFPAFTKQANAHTYSNHLLSYTAAILSIALSIRALFQKNRLLQFFTIAGAMVLQLVNFFLLEYMIGIEVLRYLLIGVVIWQRNGETLRFRAQRLLQASAIYLAPLFAFLSWRLLFFETGRRSVDAGRIFRDYLSLPGRTLVEKTSALSLDIFETVLASWFVHGYSSLGFASLRELFEAAVFTVLGLTLVLVYWFVFHRQEVAGDQKWGRTAFWVGLMAVAGALGPVIMADRQVILSHSWSRYTIHTGFAAGLLTMGALFYMTRPPWRVVIFSALLGLGMMIQYQNAAAFRADWEHQKDLWWQMSWRAPDLKPDTVLVIMPREITSFTEGYEIWAPANLLYGTDGEVKVTGQVLNKEVLTRIQRQTTDQQVVRNVVPIFRDYDEMLLAAYSNRLSCLHIIDSRLVEFGPDTPSILFLAAPGSSIDQIIPDAPDHPPPSDIFGSEPEHTWCYYYQKINLARQQADWELAAELADEALAKDFKPLERIEWMAVFEAYANAGQEDQAGEIAKILRDDKGVRQLLCSQLEDPSDKQGYQTEFILETLCGK